MTVTVTTSRVEYAGNGATTAFSVPFYFLANGDLKVYQAGTLKTITTHYTVSGAGNPAGGTVTFGTAPANGDDVVIFRDPALTQSTDYTPNDPFPAESHEQALDRLTMIAQRLDDRMGRSLVLGDSVVTDADLTLPEPEASKVIAWNSDGDGLVYMDAEDFATAAAASYVIVDEFTGDGSDTTFTLSGTPGSTDAVEVALGGVMQTPGTDYTVSGVTLTFSVAPSNGVAFFARYRQASTSVTLSVTDSGNINFQPSGVGATVRSAQLKLRDVVSAKDFGAVGDDTTDDTAALQAAIDAVAAKSTDGAVYLPAGKYKITSGLSVPYGVSIFGEGGAASVLSCLSCNGLNFRSASYDDGAMFYQDFGIEGRAGSSANWTAVESILPAGGVDGTDSRDGLHFRRLKISNFDVAFTVAATWEWSVSECKINKVNRAFSLGNYTMVTRITNNLIVHDGGDDYSGSSSAYGVEVTGAVAEGLVLSGNQIYGFDRGVNVTNSIFCNILENDISATVYGIALSTVNSGCNVRGNYVEVSGASGVAAIWEAALNSEIESQINIEGNNLIGVGTSSCYGIKIGTTAATNAFHNRIVGNLLSGFSASDIYAINPGKLLIENNRLLSTGAAASIALDAVQSAPVMVRNNECAGTITYTAGDITTGKLMLRNNVTSGSTLDTGLVIPGKGTFVEGVAVGNATPGASGIAFPATAVAVADANTLDDYEEGTFTPVYQAQTGTLGAVTYENRQGRYVKIGRLVVATGGFYTSAFNAGTGSGDLRIGGLPFTNGAQVTAVAIGDSRLFPSNNPAGGQVGLSADYITLFYRNTSDGDINNLQVSDAGSGAAANLVYFTACYQV